MNKSKQNDLCLSHRLAKSRQQGDHFTDGESCWASFLLSRGGLYLNSIQSPEIHDQTPSGLHSQTQGTLFLGGVDVGSTTAKTVILDPEGRPLFMDYRRHDARIRRTIREVFGNTLKALGDVRILLNITGSAGMGISERLHIPFIQEVVASAEVTQRFYPDVRTLLDIGGEDSKLIFFDGSGLCLFYKRLEGAFRYPHEWQLCRRYRGIH